MLTAIITSSRINVLNILYLPLSFLLSMRVKHTLPCSSVSKESACSTGDSGLISGLGRSPGEGNGNPLQYSCLKFPWTEEPGRLQSMGLQRVGHDLAIKQQQ